MSTVSLEVTRTTHAVVRVPFQAIANAALPRGFQLSLVLCGDYLAQRMNKEYRKKTYRPNVLSFEISATEGEIFLNVRKAAREARALKIGVNERLALLFVHACLHLRGHDHSDAMEALEEKILKKCGAL